jgi:hypothetical protein
MSQDQLKVDKFKIVSKQSKPCFNTENNKMRTSKTKLNGNDIKLRETPRIDFKEIFGKITKNDNLKYIKSEKSNYLELRKTFKSLDFQTIKHLK